MKAATADIPGRRAHRCVVDQTAPAGVEDCIKRQVRYEKGSEARRDMACASGRRSATPAEEVFGRATLLSGHVTGKGKGAVVSAGQNQAVRRYRERLKREGWVRCEVRIPREDVALIRGVAAVLSDPKRDAEARALLRAHFGDSSPQSLKALLAAAPLEGIDIERSADPGRVPEFS